MTAPSLVKAAGKRALPCGWRPLGVSRGEQLADSSLSCQHVHLSIQPTTSGNSPYGYIDTCIAWYAFKVIRCSIFLTVRTIQLPTSTELVKPVPLHQYTGVSSNTRLQYKQRGKSLQTGMERQMSLWLHEMVKWEAGGTQGAEEDVGALPVVNNREDRNMHPFVLRFA